MGQWIDDVARAMAGGMPRREALRRLGGGLVGLGLGLVVPSQAEAKKKKRRKLDCKGDKVGVCHLTGSDSNPVVFICVDESAVPAHEYHGDVIEPDFQDDPENCGACGVSCDDGNRCTTDTCVKGKCVNTPIACPKPDQCHEQGVCNPKTGVCSNPARPDGSECSDRDACTRNDTCQGGVCQPGDPVECPAGQICRDGDCVCPSGTRLCPGSEVCCDLDLICRPDNTCGEQCAQANNCEGQQVCGDGCTTLRAVEGDCFCHLISPCADLQTCTSSASCPAGFRCSTSCCPDPGGLGRCIPPCGAARPARARGADSGPSTGRRR